VRTIPSKRGPRETGTLRDMVNPPSRARKRAPPRAPAEDRQRGAIMLIIGGCIDAYKSIDLTADLREPRIGVAGGDDGRGPQNFIYALRRCGDKWRTPISPNCSTGKRIRRGPFRLSRELTFDCSRACAADLMATLDRVATPITDLANRRVCSPPTRKIRGRNDIRAVEQLRRPPAQLPAQLRPPTALFASSQNRRRDGGRGEEWVGRRRSRGDRRRRRRLTPSTRACVRSPDKRVIVTSAQTHEADHPRCRYIGKRLLRKQRHGDLAPTLAASPRRGTQGVLASERAREFPIPCTWSAVIKVDGEDEEDDGSSVMVGKGALPSPIAAMFRRCRCRMDRGADADQDNQEVRAKPEPLSMTEIEIQTSFGHRGRSSRAKGPAMGSALRRKTPSKVIQHTPNEKRRKRVATGSSRNDGSPETGRPYSASNRNTSASGPSSG